MACTNASPIEFTSDESGSPNEKYDGDKNEFVVLLPAIEYMHCNMNRSIYLYM